MNIAITFEESCRRCGKREQFKIGSSEVPDAPDENLIEALMAFALKRDGWAGGHCPTCLEHQFMDEADKADHNHKCQRELDP